VGSLGGVPVEQELAGQIADLIPGDAYDVDHIDAGRAVFQINRPSPAMSYGGSQSVHQRYLEERGPCVTNLNWFVDDVGHAQDLLTSLGAETLIQGPSNVARSLGDYGPENTRAGANERPFLFLGTRKLIGFDLEIMEPNFIHFATQTIQHPAFVEPRPWATGDLILHRLLVIVPDLAETLCNIARIFAPASRSKPYAARESESGRSCRVGLGGMEIEFFEFQGVDSALSPDLTNTGPGIFAIAFGTQDPETTVARCAVVATEHRPDDVLGMPAPHWHIASRSICGFDILLEPPERPLEA